MTAKEWVDLIQNEFKCSRTLAKEMYHGMQKYYSFEHRIKAVGNYEEHRQHEEVTNERL